MYSSTDKQNSSAQTPPHRTRGQATVEAACMIPVVFILLLMLVQPAILLYNQMVMENAVAESCRLLSTCTSSGPNSAYQYQEYTIRRLASVPPIDIFHVSPDGQGWQIDYSGGENSSVVTVTISHKVKMLPIIGQAAGLIGLADGDGCLTQKVTVTMPTQPAWAFSGDAGSPSQWPGQWED